MIGDSGKSAEERLDEIKKEGVESLTVVDKAKPYITNLNEDPMLNGMVNYQLSNAATHVGRKNGNPVPEIILNGLGIKPNHCSIQNRNGKLILVPGDDPASREYLFVNGQRIAGGEYELKQNDRVVVGTNSTFLVKIPGAKAREGGPSDDELTWESAQEELQGNIENSKKK